MGMKFKLGIWIMKIGAKLAGVRYVDIQYNFKCSHGEGCCGPYTWSSHQSYGFPV